MRTTSFMDAWKLSWNFMLNGPFLSKKSRLHFTIKWSKCSGESMKYGCSLLLRAFKITSLRVYEFLVWVGLSSLVGLSGSQGSEKLLITVPAFLLVYAARWPFVYAMIWRKGVTTIMKNPKPELIHHYDWIKLFFHIISVPLCPADCNLIAAPVLCWLQHRVIELVQSPTTMQRHSLLQIATDCVHMCFLVHTLSDGVTYTLVIRTPLNCTDEGLPLLLSLITQDRHLSLWERCHEFWTRQTYE